MKFVGALDGGAQNGRAEAMEVAACGVEDEQALRGEDAGVEIGEGLGEGAAGLVGGDQRVGGVGGAEQLGGALDERRDAFVEDDAADGRAADSGALSYASCFELAAGGKGDVIDFGEVVVFGGEPEDGGVGMAGGGGLAGAGDGGGGFEGGVERAAEEADLLAGDDGSGALGEGCERCGCGGEGFCAARSWTSSGQCGGKRRGAAASFRVAERGRKARRSAPAQKSRKSRLRPGITVMG